MSATAPMYSAGAGKRKHDDTASSMTDRRGGKRRKHAALIAAVAENHDAAQTETTRAGKKRYRRGKDRAKADTDPSSLDTARDLAKLARGDEHANGEDAEAVAKAETLPSTDREKNLKKQKARAVQRASEAFTVAVVTDGDEALHATAPPASQQSLRWSHSPPSGRRFIDHDPIFVQDGNGNDFILAANACALQLLSLRDSLLTRTHSAPLGQTIVDFALDSINDSLVHIAYSDMTVWTWNWTANAEAQKALLAQGNICAIASGPNIRDDTSLLLYVTRKRSQYRVFHQKQLLHVTDQPLTSVHILNNGYIVCYGPSVLLLGIPKDQPTTSYHWTEVPLTRTTTCLDVRLSPHQAGKRTSLHFNISLAIGHSDGQIHHYSDVSALFSKYDKATELPSPRILHWHRNAVSSVKFSADGNYVISGGDETVLVIWQLETGKKQTLPHLASRIERVAVNNEGNQYAVQMGDNSIMVLSTSELKPVAIFAGLAAISRPAYAGPAPAVPRMSAVLNPSRPSHLLVGVPASQPRTAKDIISRPFLQTFDLLQSRHLDRQALTRTFVSDNDVPGQNELTPPDVIHLAISHDGSWLVTVDEFTPSAKTISDMGFATSEVESERQIRRQVNLKLWSWVSEGSYWGLSGLLDSPQSRPNRDGKRGGSILDVVLSPTSSRFATVDEQGCVRIWGAKRRRQDDSGKASIKCLYTIELEHQQSYTGSHGGSLSANSPAWYLGYSTDGSILAAAYSRPPTAHLGASNRIDFIDTSTGTILSSRSGRTSDGIRGIAFLGRYYVVVATRTIHVWDYPLDKVLYSVNLPSSGEDVTSASNVELAANQDDVTFAVAVCNKVFVYSPRETKALYEQEFDGSNVERILAVKGSPGYTIVFEDVTVRTISPGSPTLTVHNTGKKLLHCQQSPMEEPKDTDMVGADMLASLTRDESLVRGVNEAAVEDDRAVITAEKLAEICEPKMGGAQPSVFDMFWGVMALCARKPTAKV